VRCIFEELSFFYTKSKVCLYFVCFVCLLFDISTSGSQTIIDIGSLIEININITIIAWLVYLPMPMLYESSPNVRITELYQTTKEGKCDFMQESRVKKYRLEDIMNGQNVYKRTFENYNY